MLTSGTNFCIQTNSVKPDQTALDEQSDLVYIVCYLDLLNGLADNAVDGII